MPIAQSKNGTLTKNKIIDALGIFNSYLATSSNICVLCMCMAIITVQPKSGTLTTTKIIDALAILNCYHGYRLQNLRSLYGDHHCPIQE